MKMPLLVSEIRWIKVFRIRDPEHDPDHHQNLMGSSLDQDAPVYQFST